MAFLYENQNRHAPVRANGRRFWGYPTRNGTARLIVLHTPEGEPLRNVANYLANTTRPASYHTLVDEDRIEVLLPTDATAFHVRGYNTVGIGLSLVGYHTRWGKDSKADLKVLRRAAAWSHAEAKARKIQLRRISKAQADAGWSGFISHAELDPSRRRDPGPNFPWATFMELVAQGGQPDPVRRYGMLVYAPKGPDMDAVRWANDNVAPVPGVICEDLAVAQLAARAGEKVIQVGGRSGAVAGSQRVAGAGRIETASAVARFAANGWR